MMTKWVHRLSLRDLLTVLTIENTDPENVDAGIAEFDTRPQFTLKISSSEAAAAATASAENG